MNITIIGLGYVGLPLACLCTEKGYKVFGLEVDKKKNALINRNESPIDDEYLTNKLNNLKNRIFATANPKECIPDSEIIIVCVPTPTDKKHLPDLSALINCIKSLVDYLKKGKLLIIESTIYPGTINEIIVPILNQKFEVFKNEIFIAHCPERIDPGNKKWNIENLPRVVGGVTKESSKMAAKFYRGIINAEIIELNSVKAAEATKILENTFRDVNIAFINEMAKSFDKAGIDIMEVIKAASSKPFAFMPHFPGVGVGGHCIAQDPYYMIERGKQLGFNHEFLSLARKINESMPSYAVELLEKELRTINKRIVNSKIGILGLAYKANVDDIRESPSFKIIEILKDKNAEVLIFDPHVPEKSNVNSINELLKKTEYLMLCTDHKEFRELDLKKLKENNIKIIIDGRNCLNKETIKKMGIVYHGIGCF